MAWLLSIYIGATIFGVGVTVIDLMGALGNDQPDSADSDGDGGADGEGDADALELDAPGDDSGDDSFGDDADGAEDADSDGPGDQEPAILGHDRRKSGIGLLRFMSFLRNIVYFALGFGPVGWFAIATGEGTPATLAWSVGSGAVILAGARILRRVLRSELTSDFKETDLLMEAGTVTVTISPGQIGKVRLMIGGAYVDRYARVTENSDAISPGARVRVVDLGADAVIVEAE